MTHPLPMRPNPPIKMSKEDAITAAISELDERHNAAGDEKVRQKIGELFHAVLNVGVAYLDGAKKFEHDTGLTIREGGTPPKYYYEAIERLRGSELTADQRTALDALDKLDVDKCHVALTCIKEATHILQVGSGIAEPSLLDRQKFTGSFVRKTLDYIQSYHQADINFCKNPAVRVAQAQKLQA